MNKFCLFVLSVFTISAVLTGCVVVKVKPKESVIVLPEENTAVKKHVVKYQKLAAEELQKHLKLVTGVEIPIVKKNKVPEGKYPFYVAIVPETDKKPIESQESRWLISPQAAYFYGDVKRPKSTQFAVYSFLTDQLGINWVQPGDAGISYEKRDKLSLKEGAFAWKPELMFRTIRSRRRTAEDQLWQQRMRMGGQRPGGGHAFTTWWKKYGKKHPEYFALNKYGKREPVPLKNERYTEQWIKICASNPGVADQIVNDWLPQKDRCKYVNACMSDGTQNFCECDACRALDVTLPGEKWTDHLTDRYVYLANAVARKVREHRPDAWVAMYAYLTTMPPPRKIKLEPNVVVQIVPYVTPLDLEVQKELFTKWKEAGARMMSLRPNFHWKYLHGPLPVGVEKQMFDVFQTVRKLGVVAVDYDCYKNNTPFAKIANYTLARSFSEPDQPFEKFEEEFYRSFGPAAEDMKKYFRYWREQVFEPRLKPNIKKVAKLGYAGSFTRGLVWSMQYDYQGMYKPEGCDAYYRTEDFDKTDAFLRSALAKDLPPEIKQRINSLKLANEHSRLLVNAMVAREPEKRKHAEKLLKWREQHKGAPGIMGGLGMWIEDAAGLKDHFQLENYPKPHVQTDMMWHFCFDPEDVGQKQEWYKKSWKELSTWPRIRTDRGWERNIETASTDPLPGKMAKVMGEYDGIAWYATRIKIPPQFKGRDIFLRFGAVDDSCWVYVNGKKAGDHVYTENADWKTPFDIPIKNCIDWNSKYQVVTVRAKDGGGQGGIWRPVWLVSKK